MFFYKNFIMEKEIYEKLFFTIGEVAKMLNVNPSHLRFLEDNFKILKPKRENNKIRRYNKTDIENIKLILYLTKEKGLTFEGAQKVMKNKKTELERNALIIEKLSTIKEQLNLIKTEL